MHNEILTKEQLELAPLIRSFSRSFGLVGGTAIALHIGHRRSIDFDLFTHKKFNNTNLIRKISKYKPIQEIIVNKEGEFTFLINNVKVTFYQFPYKLEFDKKFKDLIRTVDLLTLAAMKAFALGQRAKWKDYVDLYFIMEKYHGIDGIIKKARALFGSHFNEKIFRTQLSYFKDVSYLEKVEFLPGFEVDEKTIKKELAKYSTT
ncbi:MAG: nucleotidyl transferase AbiEii/AbiGii toxin family protein [Parcubacteria group bacterium]|jgi:hypothetical protein